MLSGLEAMPASCGGNGAGSALVIRHMKQTRKWFERQYGEMIL